MVRFSVALSSLFFFLYSLTFAQEVKPSVDFVSNSPVCQGQAIRLRASTTSLPAGTFVTYEWSERGGFIQMGQELVIPNAQRYHSGVYTVTAVYRGSYTGTSVQSKPIVVNYLGVYANAYGQEFCAGEERRLYSEVESNDPAADLTYRWTGPNGFTSTLRNPEIPQMPDLPKATYRLTVTLKGQCTLEKSTEVVFMQKSPRIQIGSLSPVGPVPPGSLYVNHGDNHDYCPGAPFELRVALVFDNLDANPEAVLWTGPKGFRSTELRPVTSGAGTYQVKARLAGCHDTVTASTEVREAIPDVRLRTVALRSEPDTWTNYQHDSLFCPGELLKLQVFVNVSGLQWDSRWTGPNGLSGTEEEVGRLTPAMSGVYSLTATYSGACSGTIVKTQQISVKTPSVQILGKKNLCEGDTLSLIPEETHGGMNEYSWRSQLTYRWTGPNGFTSNARELLIPKAGSTSAGDYRLTVSYPAFCANAEVSQTVTVQANTIPTAILPPDTTIQRGDSLRLAVRLTGGGPWRVVDWSGRSLETAQSPIWLTVRPDSTTQYTLRSVSGQCGPGTVSGPVKVTVLQPLGLSAPVLSLKAYPNPTADRLIIEWKIATGEVADLTLYDALGRQVLLSGPRTGKGEIETLEWSLASLPPGRYYLHLRAGGRVENQPVAVVLKP